MAELSEEEYKALVARAYAAFKHYPNVHSVGLGSRERKGELTGEPAIVVFVSRKLALSALSQDAIIPAHFEGYPTDVVEVAERSLLELSDVPGLPADAKHEDDAKYRPLKGGMQCSGSVRPAASGTAGFFARVEGTPRVMAVTNFHVMFDNSHPPAPGVRMGNPDTSGSCTDCCIGAFGTRVAEDYTIIDAAIAELDPNTRWLPEIQCIGFIRGWNTVTTVHANSSTYRVRKYGRTTGLTGGIVSAVNVTGSISSPDRPTRNYTNEMHIRPNRAFGGGQVKFSDKGDSGSAIVNDANEIVGVLFAGVENRASSSYGMTFSFPFADLRTKFQASHGIVLAPATATRLNDVQTTPAASPADHARALAAQALGERLERDLARTARGRMMTALWLRHSTELNRLVNTHRKMGALWRRNAGPALFQHAISTAKRPTEAIPEALGDRPVDELVERIVDAFGRYGSDALKSDIALHRRSLPSFAGRSYQDLLHSLRDHDPN